MRTPTSRLRRFGDNAPASRGERRGGVLIIGLVVLVIISIVEGVLVQGILSRRRQVLGDERRVQAEWLLESARSRAAARLSKSDSYRGETWTLTSDELNGRDAATVNLNVEVPEEHTEQRRIRISVNLPHDAMMRAREERVFLIHTGRKAAGDGR